MIRRGTHKEKPIAKEIGLEDKRVDQICGLLAPLLADLHTLYVKTLSCHWNIEDPRFYFLHELLEEQYEQLQEETDIVAERMRKLGRKVPASLKDFESLRRIGDISPHLSGNEMLEALSSTTDEITRTIRLNIDQTDKLGDAGTADMLTQLIRSFEKRGWILRSHLVS